MYSIDLVNKKLDLLRKDWLSCPKDRKIIEIRAKLLKWTLEDKPKVSVEEITKIFTPIDKI